MKSVSTKRSPLWLRDLAGVLPPTYLVLVHSRSVEFVRVLGKRFETLVRFSDNALGETELLAAFSRQLKGCTTYYGQPFAVLVDNQMAFTFIARHTALQPAQLRDQLQVLRHESATLNFVTKPFKGGTLLVAQGVDSGYLSSLAAILEEHCYPVTFVTTLAAYLALNTDLAQSDRPSLNLFSWSGTEYSYLGTTASGSVFSGAGCGSESDRTGDIVGHLQNAFFAGTETVAAHRFGAKEAGPTKTLSLSPLFKRGHSPRTSQQPVCKPVASSRSARIIAVAFNSLKLLLLVLLATTLTTGIAAGLLGLSPGEKNQAVSRYQELYGRRFSLEREMDSLKQVESTLAQRRPRTVDAAALIGLFCQAQYPGLALNSISIRSVGTDSTVVEAVGTARTDAGIFSCCQDLNALGAPAPVTIASFRPEVVNTGGTPDTVLNFKLAMVLHEKRTRQ